MKVPPRPMAGGAPTCPGGRESALARIIRGLRLDGGTPGIPVRSISSASARRSRRNRSFTTKTPSPTRRGRTTEPRVDPGSTPVVGAQGSKPWRCCRTPSGSAGTWPLGNNEDGRFGRRGVPTATELPSFWRQVQIRSSDPRCGVQWTGSSSFPGAGAPRRGRLFFVGGVALRYPYPDRPADLRVRDGAAWTGLHCSAPPTPGI